MSERSFLAILICCGLVFLYFGIRIDAPFAYGPVGPKVFPLFLGSLFVVLCIFCLLKNGRGRIGLNERVAWVGGIMIFYLISFQYLGFMLATSVAVYSAARVVGSTWMQGLLTGLITSICFYGIFHFFFKVPLPLGYIFELMGLPR